jgi:hypothetical protein
MENISGEMIKKNPADPKEPEGSHYAKKEKRDPGSHNLRISELEREAAYIRAYNRYIFGFDVQT